MNQFLILHKVRGEPSFDIAEKLECPECSEGCDECDYRGYWWICSTSGHRARPYKWWALDELELHEVMADFNSPMPPSWPDHYLVNKSPAFDGKALIARLTANAPQRYADFKRRV